MIQYKYALGTALVAATLTLTACTGINTNTGAGNDAPRSPSEYHDDATINASVQAAVVGTAGVHANDIQVTTYRGVVTLKGQADNEKAALNAVEAARSVAGVKEVNYDIKVRQQ